MNKYIEISFNYSEKMDKEQVEKEKTSKRQFANAYIAYMMIGSYFKKCKAVSPARTSFFYANYKELNPQTQYRRETGIERIFLNRYRTRLPEFREMICEVHFRKDEENVYVDFRTGIYDFTAVLGPDGSMWFTED